MATIFDMELNDVEIDNPSMLNNNACTSHDRQIIDYDEFEEDDEPIVVDNEIEVCYFLFLFAQLTNHMFIF